MLRAQPFSSEGAGGDEAPRNEFLRKDRKNSQRSLGRKSGGGPRTTRGLHIVPRRAQVTTLDKEEGSREVTETRASSQEGGKEMEQTGHVLRDVVAKMNKQAPKEVLGRASGGIALLGRGGGRGLRWDRLLEGETAPGAVLSDTQTLGREVFKVPMCRHFPAPAGLPKHSPRPLQTPPLQLQLPAGAGALSLQARVTRPSPLPSPRDPQSPPKPPL